MRDQPFTPLPTVPEAIRQAIRQMPKCNLHTHLEGSVSPETVIALAREQGVALPVPPAEVARAMQVSGDERDLADYLAKIGFVYPVLHSAGALRRVSREAAERAAAGGVRYYEMRAGPALHATSELSVRAAIAAMLEGLAEAESGTGMTCRLIVAALRHHTPEANSELARAALDFRGAGVVGFDLAGDEARFPAMWQREAFGIARAGGLGITVHAGEAAGPSGGAAEIAYAVEVLGATRIGHGVRVVEDPKTVELLIERRVTLEICPTSNVHTAAVPSIEAHPLAKLVRLGVQVTIGDDDPITSRTDLNRELALLAEVPGCALADLWAFQIAGLRSCFVDRASRDRLLAEFVERRPVGLPATDPRDYPHRAAPV